MATLAQVLILLFYSNKQLTYFTHYMEHHINLIENWIPTSYKFTAYKAHTHYSMWFEIEKKFLLVLKLCYISLILQTSAVHNIHQLIWTYFCFTHGQCFFPFVFPSAIGHLCPLYFFTVSRQAWDQCCHFTFLLNGLSLLFIIGY